MCLPCGLGKFSDARTDGAPICTPCAVGMYQDSRGETSCIQCDHDTFSAHEGRASRYDCEKCNEDQTTGSAKGASSNTACRCRREMYYESDSGVCTACPAGGDCSRKNGISLRDIDTQIGFWRSTSDSDVFVPCTKVFGSVAAAEWCVGTNRSNLGEAKSSWHSDDQCAEGSSGVLCAACAENFVKYYGKCVHCQDGASFALALIPMLGGCLTLFLVIVVVILRSGGAKMSRRSSQLKRGNAYVGQIKILLSLFQILGSMPNVLIQVEYPYFFRAFANILNGAFNLNLFSFISSCQMSVGFFDRFVIHMMLLPCCLLAVVLAFASTRCCMKISNAEQRSRINELRPKLLIDS